MITLRTRWALLLVIAVVMMSHPLWRTDAHVSAPEAQPETRAGMDLAASTAIELRRGYNGYNGVIDTYLAEESPPVAHGAEQMVHTKESVRKRSLMRFDVSQISPGANILEARLDLYAGYRYPETDASVKLYHLLKPWSESAATWVTTGLGAEWSVPGAAGVGADHAETPFATATIANGNGYRAIDVTGAVQHWVDYPGSNHGFVIVGSNVDLRFWSSDDPRETERPRLLITYEASGGFTPQPTGSVTATRTPTQVVGPTPPPANIVYSVSWAEAFDPAYPHCIEAGPITSNPSSTEDVLLVWQGTATSASLSFRYAGNNRYRHSVLVNDVMIGQLPGDNWSSVCTGGNPATLYFDPALARSGLNKISILDDGGEETSSWSLQEPRIALAGTVQATQIVSIELTSSYDGTKQRSMIQTPIGYSPGLPGPGLPLVIALHGWGGRDFDALMWLAQATNERGWLLAASDTRNDNKHSPTLHVQRDVIDLIDYMLSNPHYAVDRERIYIVGNSMGGMMASVIAAKYPDRFAALAELRGPTLLENWYWEEPSRQEALERDIGHSPLGGLFPYENKSAAIMARNLGHVPTLIIHGTADDQVDFHHATDFRDSLAPYGHVELVAYDGGHGTPAPGWGWGQILDWLGQYRLTTRPLEVNVKADESKSYYWLHVASKDWGEWTDVNAAFDPATQVITAMMVDLPRGTYDPRDTVDLGFDLGAMGLPVYTTYTVEEQNLDTGGFGQYTVAADGLLRLSTPQGRYRFVAYPHAAPPVQELIVRRGAAGPVADTYISVENTTGNYGDLDSMRLKPDRRNLPLVRFDVSALPPNAVIKSAQLRLFVWRWDSTSEMDVYVHPLLKAWNEDEATWQVAKSDLQWSQAGASGVGLDYQEPAYAAQHLAEGNKWYTFNFTELVSAWQKNPASNRGFMLLSGTGRGYLSVSSSESTNNKPELAIYYGYPTITPTPSRTPPPTFTGKRFYLPLLLARSTGGPG